MSNIAFRFWQDITKLLVDRQDGTWAERVEAYPPKVLMTDGDGQYARLRVDPGQTGFWAGREAYTFYAFSIPTGTNIVLKVVAPVNTVVQTFGADLELAALRIELVYGGTEGGTFGTSIPVFRTNSMTTASTYSPQVTFATGGTHTGGTVVDLINLIALDKVQKAAITTATEGAPLGFSAGTYYIRLTNTDGATAAGVFRARWEERP